MPRSPSLRSTAKANSSSVECDGLTAVCVQHEMDHLLGKVFVEYLSPLKRERIRVKMQKRTREEQQERQRV